MVTDDINEEYGTDLVIKKVDLSLLGSVSLKGVEIRDHHQDTLIFVDRIRTSLLNAKRVLDNKVELKSTSFKGIHVYMKTYKDETNDNLSIFVDKFEDDNPRDSTAAPFELRTSNVYLEDVNFKLIDENINQPLEFGAFNGGGSLQDFSVVGPKVGLKIRGLYFTDNRGLDITSLTTNFQYTKQQMQFYKTTLKTPYSLLQAELEFNYDRKNLSTFNELVNVDATFKNSYLSVKDLKKLYSELNGNDVLRFDAKLQGSLNNFSVENLRLNSDKGIRIYGDLNFINAIKQEEFFLTGDLENVTANYYKLKDILPNLLGKTLPTEFKKLGTFSLSGFTKVTPNVIEATLDIDSEVGTVITDLELTDFDDIDKATYKGEVELLDFDLGTFFNDPLFGNIDFKGDVDGTGFRIDNINTELIGKVSKIDFNQYVYQDINVNGTYQNNLFDGDLQVDDANLKMNFSGLADLSEDVNQFDFKADISYVDLKATNLYTRDSISELKGVIDFDLKGDKIDNIIGIANFKNIEYKNQKDTYPFKQFLIFSTVKDSIRQIRFDSEDIVKGELKGDFKFAQLLPLAQNALGSIYANYTPFEVEPHQFINFDFAIYNQIVEIFLPEVSIGPNTTVKGRIKADDNSLRLTVSSPKIIAYGNEIDTLLLRTDNKVKLYNTHLTASRVKTPYYKVSKLNLINRTVNDTLFFKTLFKGGDFEKEDFNLDFYYTINENKKSVVGIEKSTFNFKENVWDINPMSNRENKVTFDLKTDEFNFSQFLLKSNEQEIKFAGKLRDSTYKNFEASFKDVALKSFLPEVDSLTLRGKLNGKIDFSQENGLYSPKGILTVDDFHINDFEQGDLFLNVQGESSYEKYSVVLSLDRDQVKSIDATGTIDFSKERPELDLAVFMEDFQLNAFSPLGEDVLSKVRGSASGNFTLKGFLSNPVMDGSLNLKGAGLQFPYLNIDYNLDEDTSIGLVGQSFVFNNIGMQDTKHGTRGILGGDITHKDFNQWYLNLNISSDNLLVLDTEDSLESLYYGTGFINGSASIYGLTNNIYIDVNAQTMPNTKFVIPLKDVASIDNYRLIHFKSEKTVEELQKEIAIEDIEGVALNINLEVTKDAIAQVVIDEVNGSELTGSGTGDLRIEINTRGKFNMFGDYAIDRGVYNLKYVGLVSKPFEILKGGTISWSGNPYEANLNVTAVYTVKANPAVLLENFNTNRKIDIDLITKISGSLFNSTQEFDISIPNSNSTIASELDFVLNDNDVNSKMRQFLSLLIAGSFVDPNRGNIDGGELLTGTTSNVIGDIISDIVSSNKLQLNVGYTSGQGQNPQDAINTDSTVDVSLTSQISDRVIINGKVGVPVGAQTQSSVVGEVKVEVLLNESGNFRGVIFNRQNEIQYSAQEEGYTQGIGLSYQVNFNTLSELLQKTGLKKKGKKEKVKKKKDTVYTHYKLLNFKKSNN